MWNLITAHLHDRFHNDNWKKDFQFGSIPQCKRLFLKYHAFVPSTAYHLQVLFGPIIVAIPAWQTFDMLC